jgi:cytosine/adenosine deaminase-related metal-dependent hydrolase
MINAGVNVSLGTDNVMLNQPNMLREMEYLFKTSYLSGSPLTPAEVLRTATCNGFKAFNIPSGLLEKGMHASLLFVEKNAINLKYSRNIAASIVSRCEPENIRKVMVDGRIVLNKDGK